MTLEPGRQMDRAMKAVIKMHGDCIKLFNDLDAAMDGFDSYFAMWSPNSWEARSTTASISPTASSASTVEARNNADMLGINVCFYDLNDPGFVEPILVAAHIVYQPMTVDQTEKCQRGFDRGSRFFHGAKIGNMESRFRIERPGKRGTIEHLTVAAQPLFSVNSIESVLSLIDMVGRPE